MPYVYEALRACLLPCVQYLDRTRWNATELSTFWDPIIRRSWFHNRYGSYADEEAALLLHHNHWLSRAVAGNTGRNW